MTRTIVLLAAALMTFGFRGSDPQGDSPKSITYTIRIESRIETAISFEGAYLSQDKGAAEFKHISGTTPFTLTVRSSRLYCLFNKTSGEGNYSIVVTGDVDGKKWKVNSGTTGNATAIIYDKPLIGGIPDPSGIHLF